MTADSLGKPDLEVFVEQLAPERHPVGEHGGGHEADRLPVHQEPLDGGQGEVVGEAGELDPEANIIVGSTLDTGMEGSMRVSVVATGIDANQSQRPVPVATPAAVAEV